MTISPTTVYFALALILYLWIVGGLGWKGLYEEKFERTFTTTGTAVLIILFPLLAGYSGVKHLIDVWNGKEEED